MSIVRPMLTVFVIVALPASCVLAQDRPATEVPRGSQSFESLDKEYRDACKAWETEYASVRGEARKDGKEKDVRFAKPHPTVVFSPRFLAIVEKDPEGPEALNALTMAFRGSFGAQDGTALETRRKTVKILRDYYVAEQPIKGVLKVLGRMDDDDSRALLAEVIARNPDRKIQAAAYKVRIDRRRGLIEFADFMKDPQNLAAAEKAQGKDSVRETIVAAEKARIEVAAWRKTLRENYGEVFNDLSIGNAAPEIHIQTVDGKEATLSALKGKVVVLDIWTTWCPPCRAMIPHEREMVERLRDKPFALVSISFDEKKEAVTKFLAKEKMPWTHWWNGDMSGGPMENWAVGSYPTIYVLDANGVIRHKDIRGEALEKAVNALLTGAEKKPVSGLN